MISVTCATYILLCRITLPRAEHNSDVIMGAIASQITSLTIVYSTVYSDAHQRKHQSSASLAFVREFTGDRWIPRTNGQWRGKWFHLMTSSWSKHYVYHSPFNFQPTLWIWMHAWPKWAGTAVTAWPPFSSWVAQCQSPGPLKASSSFS